MVSRREIALLSGGAMLGAGVGSLAAAVPLKAQDLVDEWLKRLNALADWTSEADAEMQVAKFVELFDPEAIQFTGPNQDQIGRATYSGYEGIRVWAQRFGQALSKSEYQIQAQTLQEKTAGLLHTAEPPWGGISVGVELLTLGTTRDTRKRSAAPAAAFLEFTDQGKIRRVRLYLLKDETFEINP
jgi:hypothetical protein